jgi:hypothetical protein
MSNANMRHAYLIMAHNNIEQLNILLRILDSESSDLYVHIDTKSSINEGDIYSPSKSKLYFYKEISVFWADYSQIECELFLLKKAVSDNYHYYHLLSGADMPLKTPKEIANLLATDNRIYLHYSKESDTEIVKDYFKYYHFLQKQLYIVNRDHCFSWYKVLNKLILFGQKLIGINRCKDGIVIKKGANWFSIPSDAAQYVIEQEKWIFDRFDKTRSGDELFLQTLFFNSDFKSRLFRFKEDDSYDSCLRYIDWKRGNPYIFRLKDYDEIINSNMLFARKFDWNIDKDIIIKIYDFLVSLK